MSGHQTLIDKTFEECVFFHFTDEERTIYHEITSLFSKSIQYIKEKKIAIANELLSKGEAFVQKIDKSGLLFNILQTEYYPKKALLLYKTKNYYLAKICTLRSIATCYYIERIWELDFLYFARVQQYHNIIRIYFKIDSCESAMSVAINCLSALLIGNSSLLNVNANEALYKKIEYQELRYLFICQIYFETLREYCRLYKAMSSSVQILAFHFKNLSGFIVQYKPQNEHEEILKHYLYVFDLFFTGDYENFESQSDKIISEIPDIQNKAKDLLGYFRDSIFLKKHYDCEKKEAGRKVVSGV